MSSRIPSGASKSVVPTGSVNRALVNAAEGHTVDARSFEQRTYLRGTRPFGGSRRPTVSPTCKRVVRRYVTSEQKSSLPATFTGTELVKQIKSNTSGDVSCATAVGAHVWVALKDGSIIVCDGQSGTELGRSPRRDVHCTVMLAVGEYVWGGFSDGFVRIFAQGTREVIVEFCKHSAAITALADQEDGRYVFSSSRDSTVVQWEKDDPSFVGRFVGHVGGINTVAVRVDRLFTGGDDGVIRVWDLYGAVEPVAEWRDHQGAITSLIVVGDFLWGAAASAVIKVWNVSGVCVDSMEIPSSQQASGLSVVGSTVWATSVGQVFIFDAQSRRLVGRRSAHDVPTCGAIVSTKAMLCSVWTFGIDGSRHKWHAETHLQDNDDECLIELRRRGEEILLLKDSLLENTKALSVLQERCATEVLSAQDAASEAKRDCTTKGFQIADLQRKLMAAKDELQKAARREGPAGDRQRLSVGAAPTALSKAMAAHLQAMASKLRDAELQLQQVPVNRTLGAIPGDSSSTADAQSGQAEVREAERRAQNALHHVEELQAEALGREADLSAALHQNALITGRFDVARRKLLDAEAVVSMISRDAGKQRGVSHGDRIREAHMAIQHAVAASEIQVSSSGTNVSAANCGNAAIPTKPQLDVLLGTLRAQCEPSCTLARTNASSAEIVGALPWHVRFTLRQESDSNPAVADLSLSAYSEQESATDSDDQLSRTLRKGFDALSPNQKYQALCSLMTYYTAKWNDMTLRAREAWVHSHACFPAVLDLVALAQEAVAEYSTLPSCRRKELELALSVGDILQEHSQDDVPVRDLHRRTACEFSDSRNGAIVALSKGWLHLTIPRRRSLVLEMFSPMLKAWRALSLSEQHSEVRSRCSQPQLREMVKIAADRVRTNCVNHTALLALQAAKYHGPDKYVNLTVEALSIECGNFSEVASAAHFNGRFFDELPLLEQAILVADVAAEFTDSRQLSTIGEIMMLLSTDIQVDLRRLIRLVPRRSRQREAKDLVVKACPQWPNLTGSQQLRWIAAHATLPSLIEVFGILRESWKTLSDAELQVICATPFQQSYSASEFKEVLRNSEFDSLGVSQARAVILQELMTCVPVSDEYCRENEKYIHDFLETSAVYPALKDAEPQLVAWCKNGLPETLQADLVLKELDDVDVSVGNRKSGITAQQLVSEKNDALERARAGNRLPFEKLCRLHRGFLVWFVDEWESKTVAEQQRWMMQRNLVSGPTITAADRNNAELSGQNMRETANQYGSDLTLTRTVISRDGETLAELAARCRVDPKYIASHGPAVLRGEESHVSVPHGLEIRLQYPDFDDSWDNLAARYNVSVNVLMRDNCISEDQTIPVLTNIVVQPQDHESLRDFSSRTKTPLSWLLQLNPHVGDPEAVGILKVFVPPVEPKWNSGKVPEGWISLPKVARLLDVPLHDLERANGHFLRQNTRRDAIFALPMHNRSISELAQILDTDGSAILEVNPHVANASQSVYGTILIPASSTARIRSASAPLAAAAGDRKILSLRQIAEKMNLDSGHLLEANPGVNYVDDTLNDAHLVRMPLHTATSLRQVSESLGIPLHELSKRNPQMDPDDTLPVNQEIALPIVDSRSHGATVLMSVDGKNIARPDCGIPVLTELSETLGLSLKDLCSANPTSCEDPHSCVTLPPGAISKVASLLRPRTLVDISHRTGVPLGKLRKMNPTVHEYEEIDVDITIPWRGGPNLAMVATRTGVSVQNLINANRGLTADGALQNDATVIIPLSNRSDKISIDSLARDWRVSSSGLRRANLNISPSGTASSKSSVVFPVALMAPRTLSHLAEDLLIDPRDLAVANKPLGRHSVPSDGIDIVIPVRSRDGCLSLWDVARSVSCIPSEIAQLNPNVAKLDDKLPRDFELTLPKHAAQRLSAKRNVIKCTHAQDKSGHLAPSAPGEILKEPAISELNSDHHQLSDLLANQRLVIPSGSSALPTEAIVSGGNSVTACDIAAERGVSVTVLRELNPAVDFDSPITPGTRIQLRKPTAGIEEKVVGTVHVSKAGETLQSIAFRHGILLDILAAANPTIDPCRSLSNDTSVFVPASKSAITMSIYTVVGVRETVASVAHRHGLQSDDIVASNPSLRGCSRLLEGQQIIICPRIPVAHVVMHEKDTLQSLATHYGITLEKIQALNPDIGIHQTELGRIISLTSQRAAKAFEEASLDAGRRSGMPDRALVHYVMDGDTVDSLAYKYGVEEAAIRHHNYDIDGAHDVLLQGRRVIIPRPVTRKAPKTDRRSSPRKREFVVPSSGDTIDSISRRFGVPPQKLRSSNGFARSVTKLRRDTRVVIPQSEEVDWSDSSTNRLVTYVSAAGDSIQRIALRFGVPEAAIRRWNPTLAVRKDGSVAVHKNVNLVHWNSCFAYSRHEVQSGETPHEIATRFGVDLSNLRTLNCDFTEGSVIVIPPVETNPHFACFHVGVNDSVEDFARRFGVSSLELADANPQLHLSDTGMIPSNVCILVPRRPGGSAPAAGFRVPCADSRNILGQLAECGSLPAAGPTRTGSTPGIKTTTRRDSNVDDQSKIQVAPEATESYDAERRELADIIQQLIASTDPESSNLAAQLRNVLNAFDVQARTLSAATLQARMAESRCAASESILRRDVEPSDLRHRVLALQTELSRARLQHDYQLQASQRAADDMLELTRRRFDRELREEKMRCVANQNSIDAVDVVHGLNAGSQIPERFTRFLRQKDRIVADLHERVRILEQGRNAAAALALAHKERLDSLSFVIDSRPSLLRVLMDLYRMGEALTLRLETLAGRVNDADLGRAQTLRELSVVEHAIRDVSRGQRWVIGNMFTDVEIMHLGASPVAFADTVDGGRVTLNSQGALNLLPAHLKQLSSPKIDQVEYI